jgi:hypothetical protein
MPAGIYALGIGGYPVADGTAVTASGAITELSPTAPQKILPAGSINDFGGHLLEFNADGYYTTTATQGTITIGVYTGTIGQAITAATAWVATGAITWVASQTNRLWSVSGTLQVRTMGAAGTGVGYLAFTNLTGTNAIDQAASAAGAAATIDTTVARYVALGATLSVASQSITCRKFSVNLMN